MKSASRPVPKTLVEPIEAKQFPVVHPPPRDAARILSATSAVLYAVESLRARLEGQLTPELRDILTVLEERASQIQQEIPALLRMADYLAQQGNRPVSMTDGTLADAVRCERDHLPFAQARCIHAKGWKLGLRPVPIRVARDALRPVLDVALATRRSRILLEFHNGADAGAWLSISWRCRAADLVQGAIPSLSNPVGRGVPIPSLAALAAKALGCAWQQVATLPSRIRWDLCPRPPGETLPAQAASRFRAKTNSPAAVSKALASSNSVPKR